jgi:steroid delta-isomerase-like uncharacterized protein
MSAEENMRIVRRIYEQVFDKHNLEVFDELYATDFCYHSPAGRDRDRQSLKAAFAAYLAAFPDVRMTIEDMFAAGDKVAVRFAACGTHQSAYLGAPPSGKHVTITAILIHRLAGGKLAEDWEWQDLLGFMQQLGLVSMPQ